MPLAGAAMATMLNHVVLLGRDYYISPELATLTDRSRSCVLSGQDDSPPA